jgi:hypothetical protein
MIPNRRNQEKQGLDPFKFKRIPGKNPCFLRIKQTLHQTGDLNRLKGNMQAE